MRLRSRRTSLRGNRLPNQLTNDLVRACIADEATALSLIKAGARVPPEQRVYALELCVANRQLRVLDALVKSDAQLARLLTHRDVMLQAILKGNIKLIDRLVARGAKLPANLLDLAITADSYKLIERALRAPDARKKAGPSSRQDDAMCRAAWKGDIRMMTVLAKAGVPLHPTKAGQTTPLRKAATASPDRALAAVTWLVERGAPADAPSTDGYSALYLALIADNEDVALYLASKGADCSVVATLDRRRYRKISAHAWQTLLALARR